MSNQTSMDIKRCPCCDGPSRAEVFKRTQLAHMAVITCARCGIRTDTIYHEDKDGALNDALEIWNRRAK
jgi:hypothetical protein